MASGGKKLIIHTGLIPEQPVKAEPVIEAAKPAQKWVRWNIKEIPMFGRITGRRGARKRTKHKPQKYVPEARKLTTGEKLMRNTAIACALMISLVALKNIDHPVTREVSGKITRAVTMRIDLDETLGKLNFVRNWMPDAAQVFWNMEGSEALAAPVSGVIAHQYDQAQPWLEYKVFTESPVFAAHDGTVAAVGQGAAGDWTVLIDHANGEQTVYAFVHSAIVKAGQAVARGAQIGVTGEGEGQVYFELRKDGIPTDPTGRLRSR